jgi:hypothetical protein
LIDGNSPCVTVFIVLSNIQPMGGDPSVLVIPKIRDSAFLFCFVSVIRILSLFPSKTKSGLQCVTCTISGPSSPERRGERQSLEISQGEAVL